MVTHELKQKGGFVHDFHVLREFTHLYWATFKGFHGCVPPVGCKLENFDIKDHLRRAEKTEQFI